MSPLDLGERLSVEVEMMKERPSLLPDKGTPVLPSVRNRNEIQGRREFDVDAQILFDGRNGAEEVVAVREDLDIHVDGAIPPSTQDCRGAARKVDSRILVGLRPQGA